MKPTSQEQEVRNQMNSMQSALTQSFLQNGRIPAQGPSQSQMDAFYLQPRVVAGVVCGQSSTSSRAEQRERLRAILQEATDLIDEEDLFDCSFPSVLSSGSQ